METPSLLNYLAQQVLLPITKKTLFNGKYFLFGEYLQQAQLLFESSCALGHEYRNNIRTFSILFSEEGKEKSVAEFLSVASTQRHMKYKAEHNNFFDFFGCVEGPNIMRRFHEHKILPTANWADFPNFFNKRIPNDLAFSILPMLCLEGIAFGYKYPEIVEKLFSFTHNSAEWRLAFDAGLNIDRDPPKMKSLQEMQVESKGIIKSFVIKYQPNLLSSLNLN